MLEQHQRLAAAFVCDDNAGDGGGFGLGLAIVRELVVGDGGRVELAVSPAGGLRVIVRLRPAEHKRYVVADESRPLAPERRPAGICYPGEQDIA